MADKILHTKAEVLKKSLQEDQGVVDAVVGSSNVLDRMGDVISQDGWKLDNYTKSNPVILWGHNIHEERPPIGKALKVWLEGKQTRTKKLMFKVKFDLQDPFAAEIFRKIKDGFLNTVSVGFLPLEWEEINNDKGNYVGGRKYISQELLELSVVPVPANPEASIALRGMKDKRLSPVELKDLYPQSEELVSFDGSTEPSDSTMNEKIEDELVVKPYENEHSCRLRNPDDFADGSFRSMKRKHDGKEYRVIMGKLEGETTMTEQAYRYDKSVWEAGEASAHCKSHDGSFEAAARGFGGAEPKPEENPKVPVEEISVEKPVEETPKVEVPEAETPVEEKPAEEKPVEEAPAEEVSPPKEPVEEKPAEEVPAEEEPKVEEEPLTPKDEPQAPEPEMETKGAIPFKDLGTVPESEGWDGSGEMAKAEVEDLKLMCAWFDSAEPDNKGSYKLPHHKADGHKCVWRGVAAAMAAILGARGGVELPEGDKKGVYNHLAKHYKQFDKEVPDFKFVEDQVLANFEEEIHALVLDREEKHVVRLIKKVIQTQKKEKLLSADYSPEELKSALKVIDSALSQLLLNSPEGGVGKVKPGHPKG